jgi:TRAP-type mannitol/chloroaromatic compound transport system permease small subunit
MRILTAIAGGAAMVCGYLLLALSFLIGFEIVARKLVGLSVQGVDELGGYMLAVLGAIGYGYTLVCRMHTRIDILVTRVPTAMQAVLNALGMLAMAGFALFLVWQATLAFTETVELGSIANSPLSTPLWMPQSIWLTGHVLFALVALGLALHVLYLLATDRRAVNLTYGPPSIEEELEAQCVTRDAAAVRSTPDD